MGQKLESFKKLLEFGEEGEKEVALKLLNKGYTVLPLYQFNKEHSPFLLSKQGKITLPDLDCYNENKESIYVEVKSKRQWNITNGIIETGFNLKQYNEYKIIQDKTQKKVFIVFNHKGEHEGFYITSLDNIHRIWYGENKKGEKKYKSLVFYKKNNLTKI
jgi:hypothetical protein|tara:strand:+ start:1827 stop:2306 length:480 start_codon:yes stop_codon:yes gene_type:complete